MHLLVMFEGTDGFLQDLIVSIIWKGDDTVWCVVDRDDAFLLNLLPTYLLLHERFVLHLPPLCLLCWEIPSKHSYKEEQCLVMMIFFFNFLFPSKVLFST